MPIQKSWVLGSAAGVLLAAALLWAFAPRPTEVEVEKVRQTRFEQSIEEEGRTRLKQRYTISAPLAAQLSRIALREGDRVTAGDTVATLRPAMSPLLDARSRQEAISRIDAATARVRSAQAAQDRAGIALQDAWVDMTRTRQLAEQGFVAPSRLDTSRLAVSAAARALEAAHAERDVAIYQEAQAKAALEPTNTRAGKAFALQAPVSGVVLRVLQTNAATVQAGTALIDVGDPTQMEVLCELLTADAVQAVPGRRALIERWGGPPVQGHVRRVEPAGFTKVSALGVEEQRVNVLIDLDNPPETWRTIGEGFRVSVRIITREVSDAVVVPVGALFAVGDRDVGMGIYVQDGDRVRVRTLEVAGRNSSVAWVRNGIAPGESVVVYPPPQLLDGARVKVRAP